MTAQDYIQRYNIVLKDDGFYHYEDYNHCDCIFDDDEIEVLADYELDPDTKINVMSLSTEQDILRVDEFDNGLHQLYYYMCRVLNETEGLDVKIRNAIRTKMDIYEMDYTDFADKVKARILYDMECHEASTHFEDYMNPPQSGSRQKEVQ